MSIEKLNYVVPNGHKMGNEPNDFRKGYYLGENDTFLPYFLKKGYPST